MTSETKKMRKPNFMAEQIRCLLQCIGQEKESIQCKLQGALTGWRKKEAWEKVLFNVNSCSSRMVRTYEEIKKKWKDLKAAVMKEQVSQKQTGSGGPMKETPYKELLLFIIGDRSDVVSGIHGMYGTDGSFICCNFLSIYSTIGEFYISHSKVGLLCPIALNALLVIVHFHLPIIALSASSKFSCSSCFRACSV